MKRKSKEFEVVLINEESVNLYIRRPNQRELFLMDKVQRLAMTELLAAGVASSHKLTKILAKNEEWDRSDENDMHNLAKMVAAHSKALRDEKENHTEEENTNTARKIMEWRARHLELIGRKYDLFESCAERQADQQKMHVFAQLCCYRADNEKPFFKDKEAYGEFLEEDQEAICKIITMVYAFDHGTDEEEFGKDWAEIEYLINAAREKKEEEDLEDEDLEDEDDEDLVNLTEILISEEVAESDEEEDDDEDLEDVLEDVSEVVEVKEAESPQVENTE